MDAGNSGKHGPDAVRNTGRTALHQFLHRRRFPSWCWPTQRIIEPLQKFGATLTARDGNDLPLTIRGVPPTAIDYTLPVASAQVKSAILLAAMQAQGVSRVTEPAPTRNHTELALAAFGAPIRSRDDAIEVEGGNRLIGGNFQVRGPATAAFLIAAAAAIPDSRLELHSIGINPTRSGFLTLIEQMGARIRVENTLKSGNELVGDLIVEGAELQGTEVAGTMIPNVIDEIPVLAALGLRANGGIRVRDAAELRTKESDRIRAVVTNLAALGVTAEEAPDGFYVPGMQIPHSGTVDSMADHRIAMAFSVAALFADGPVTIRNAECVAISFPEFFKTSCKASLFDKDEGI